MRGPYETGPYRYVCEWCWKKSYMFFPDKGKPGKEDAFYLDEKEILATAPVVELEVTNGRKVAAKLVTVPIRQLRLNPGNPRVRLRVSDPDEVEIEEWLWREEGTRSLYNEVKYSGGLSEKPIIDSKLVVLEGNRRTVCLRRLDDQVKNGELTGYVEDNFSKVQCLMLPEDVDPKDVELLVARAHVSGKKEWSPLNQAEQIYEMVNKYGMTSKEITNALSLGPHSVELMLKAFNSTMEYGGLYSHLDNKWIHKFSYFYELFRSRRLQDWAKSKRNQKLFMRLLLGEKPKLYRGSQVRDLPLIVTDPVALRLLRTRGFDQAIEKIKTEQPKTTQLNKGLIEAANIIRRITRDPAKISDPASLRVLGEIRKKTGFILAKTSQESRVE